ncbi:MAG: hypothetical protein IT266_11265 [Saprospiraceae bacterium]|nr:hypothetical protein [Saprospiraceae bacterium]
MAIDFDHYSYLFSEAELFELKQLIDGGAVVKANQIRLNFWNYTLRMDGVQLECELGFNKKSIKSVVCACGHRGTASLCRHAKLLALWHITRIYQRKSSHTDVSPRLLESIRVRKQEELSFLVDFALKYDQHLRGWYALFAKAFDSSPEHLEEQWRMVTDFIRHLKFQIKSKLARDRKFLLLGQTYYQLGVQQFSRGELSKGAILLLITHRMALYQYQTCEPANPTRFAQLATQACHALEEVLRGIIAPESREFFIATLSAEVAQKEYRPLDAGNNLFVILLPLVKQSTARQEIMQRLRDKCLMLPFAADLQISWETYLKIDPKGFSELFMDLPPHLEGLSPHVAGFIASHHSRIPGSLCFDLIRSLFPRLNIGLQQMLGQIVAGMNYIPIRKQEFQFAAELYASYPDPKLLKWLFSSTENAQDKRKYLLQAIDRKMDNPDTRRRAVYEVLFHGAFHQELVNVLLDAGDVDSIMDYDHRIDPALRLKLFPLFSHYMSNYRLQNAGPKAKREIRRVLHHLENHYRMHLPPGIFKNLTSV